MTELLPAMHNVVPFGAIGFTQSIVNNQEKNPGIDFVDQKASLSLSPPNGGEKKKSANGKKVTEQKLSAQSNHQEKPIRQPNESDCTYERRKELWAEIATRKKRCEEREHFNQSLRPGYWAHQLANGRPYKLPKRWQPSSEAIEFAEQLFLGSNKRVTAELEKFTDHYVASATPKADWDAAFRSWCRKANEFNPAR
jgi:hypothetical protein